MEARSQTICHYSLCILRLHVDQTVVVVLRKVRQISIQCHRIIILTLRTLAAQLLGTLKIIATIGGQEVGWIHDEVRLECGIRIVAGHAPKFPCEQRRAHIGHIAIGEHPFEAKVVVHTAHIVEIEGRHLAIGQGEIIQRIETPIAKETSGFILQIEE